MSILVTGARGFIGQHVCALLNQPLDLIDSLEAQVHGVAGTCTLRAGHCYLDKYEAVIHLAALVGVGQSMYQPARYVECNTLDTARFLERLSQRPPKRLVVASSMSIYGEGGRAVESQAPDIRSVYALTKYDQEQLCLMWGRRHGVPVVALRFFNCYGPGQALTNPYTGALAIFATRLLNGRQPVIYEDGQQTRDFVFVSDIAAAVVHAATTSIPAGIYNVGTGQACTIEAVALELAAALCSDIKPLITNQTREGDIRHCWANADKLRATGWEPQVTLREGMKRYATWLLTQPTPQDRFEQATEELSKHGLVR